MKQRVTYIIYIFYFVVNYGCNNSNFKKEYYEDGHLKSETSYENGKKNGNIKSYYETGNIMAEYNFVNGKLEGIGKNFYDNGQIKSEIEYKDSLEDGLAKYYYPNGKLSEQGVYVNGKENGRYKEYFESGSVKTEGGYRNGKQEGLTESYYENGQLNSKAMWKDGKQIGKYLIYYPNAQLQMIAFYDSLEGVPYYYRKFNIGGDSIMENNPQNIDIKKLLFEFREVKIDVSSEKIKLGEEIIITISITGENFINAKVLIGEIDGFGKIIENKVEKEIQLKNNKAIYITRPQTVGTHRFTGNLLLKNLDGKIENYLIKSSFEVLK